MSKLKIISAPHPILRKKAIEIKEVNDEIRVLMDDMLFTMDEDFGLAANQIGRLERVIVLDTRYGEERKEYDPLKRLTMANPKIIFASAETEIINEGCLSVPGFRIDVERPVKIVVSYLDYHNKPQEHEFDGYDARCIQHEIDHLDGKLMIDYVSKLKKDTIIRRLLKEQKHISD